MNIDVARKLIDAGLEASGCLNRALRDARSELSEEEFENLRRRIASAMGEIHCEVLRPLWKAHPQLEAEQIERESR